MQAIERSTVGVHQKIACKRLLQELTERPTGGFFQPPDGCRAFLTHSINSRLVCSCWASMDSPAS